MSGLIHIPSVPGRHRGNQGGVSLIELMIAMTVGLLIVLAVTAMVLGNSRSNRELNLAAQQLENGRYAMHLLREELQHAGFYGLFYLLPPPPLLLPDPCATDLVSLLAGIALPVQGFDAPVGNPPLSCLNDANHLDGTDILVVRRSSTEVTAVAAMQPGTVYLQAQNADMVMDLGQNGASFTLTKKDGVTLSDIRRFRVDIYFISPCSRPVGVNCDASADNGNPVPSLKRLELDSGGLVPVFRTVTLAENIQDLQIDWGLDRDFDGAVTLPYVTLPATPAEWGDVMGTVVHLLARNPEVIGGHVDVKTYHRGLAGALGPFNDGYRRHIFTAAVRLQNPSMRRER